MIANGFEGERQKERETEWEEDKQIQEIVQGRDKKLAETLVGANFFKKSRPWADLPDFLIIGCDCSARTATSATTSAALSWVGLNLFALN